MSLLSGWFSASFNWKGSNIVCKKKSNLRFVYIRVNLLILKYTFIHNHEPHTQQLNFFLTDSPMQSRSFALRNSLSHETPDRQQLTQHLHGVSWTHESQHHCHAYFLTLVSTTCAGSSEMHAHTVNKKLVTYSLIQTGILTHALHHSLASLFLSCFFALSSLTTLAVFRSF